MKAKDLIRKLLATDVTQRLGCLRNAAEDVKTHRWFGRMNWDQVYDCKTTSPFVPDVSGAAAAARGCACATALCLTAAPRPPWPACRVSAQVRGADDTRNFDEYPESPDGPMVPLTSKQKALFEEFDRM